MDQHDSGRPAVAATNCGSVGITHQGRRRVNNEDNFLLATNEKLWAVADGMGGHRDGEYASAVALTSVVRAVRTGASLVAAIEAAHVEILAAAQSGFGALGMGSTIVGLRTIHDQFHIAWIGDCRAYLWNGAISRLTRDHTLGEALIEHSHTTIADQSDARARKQLYKSVGAPEEKNVTADSMSGQWQSGDVIILCSDGLTDELTDEDIANAMQQCPSVEQACDELLKNALANGGRDNITMVLVFPIDNDTNRNT